MDILGDGTSTEDEMSEESGAAGSTEEEEVIEESDQHPVVDDDDSLSEHSNADGAMDEIVITDGAEVNVEKAGAEGTFVMPDFDANRVNQYPDFILPMDGLGTASPVRVRSSPWAGRRLSRSQSLDRGLVDDFELLDSNLQGLPVMSGEDVSLTLQNLSSSFYGYRSPARNSFLPASRSPSPDKRTRARSEGESTDYSAEFLEKWATVDEYMGEVAGTKSTAVAEMSDGRQTDSEDKEKSPTKAQLSPADDKQKKMEAENSGEISATELSVMDAEEGLPTRVHAVSLGAHGKLYAPMICFIEDREKNRKINDYQVDKLVKTFTTMPVRAMATAFIAVPAFASPAEIPGYESFKEWDLKVVKRLIADKVAGFLRVKGGNHRMRAFGILQQENVLTNEVEIEVKVYLGLDEDDALWLAAEDNLVTGCTLPPQFVDFIELLRSLMIEVISQRKDMTGSPFVIDPGFPIPKLEQAESSFVKRKLLKQTDITDFEYAQKVSRYLDLARYPERSAETVVQFLTQLESPAKDRIQNLKGKFTFICEDKQRLILSPSHITKIMTVQVEKKHFPRPWTGQTGIIALMMQACVAKSFSGFRTLGLSVPDVSVDDPSRRRSVRRSSSLTEVPVEQTGGKNAGGKKRKSSAKGGEPKRGKSTVKDTEVDESNVPAPVLAVKGVSNGGRVSLRIGRQVLSLPFPGPNSSENTSQVADTAQRTSTAPPAPTVAPTSKVKKGVDGKTLFFGGTSQPPPLVRVAHAVPQQAAGETDSSDIPEDLSSRQVRDEENADGRSTSPSPSSRRKQAAPRKAAKNSGLSGKEVNGTTSSDLPLLARLRDRVVQGQFTVQVSQGGNTGGSEEDVQDAEESEEEAVHEVISQCPDEFIIKAPDAFIMFRNLSREFTVSVIRLGLQRLTFLAPMFCKSDGVPTVHRTDFVRYRLYRTPDFSPKVVEVDEDDDDLEHKKKKKNRKKNQSEPKNSLIKVIDFGWLLKSKTAYSPKEANTDKELQIVIPKTGKKTDKLKTAMLPATVVLDGRLFIPIESNHVSYYSNTISFGSAKFLHSVVDRLYPEMFRDLLWKGQLNNPTTEVPDDREFIDMAPLFPQIEKPEVSGVGGDKAQEGGEESGDGGSKDSE